MAARSISAAATLCYQAIMTTRIASCSCGGLKVTVEGEPVRVSICHCLECQKRTGSVFGAQARFTRENIVGIEGQSTEYLRIGDEGCHLRFRFCPRCGSTVRYTIDEDPDLVAIPIGCFADPQFTTPTFSVYERRKHSWVVVPDVPGMVRED
jgi:hypothetical protein